MIERIVSGGQTGVDRAALDAALAFGMPCGGWCPRGRKAEDGRIPDRYPLSETVGASYPERTALNVADSDGTLVITRGPLTGGTALTAQIARQRGRPCLVLTLDGAVDLTAMVQWLEMHCIAVLNVAGPRESQQPGIYVESRRLMERVLTGNASLRSATGKGLGASPQSAPFGSTGGA